MNRPLDVLIQALARLPGLGRRSAERAALALVLREPLARELSAALKSASERLCCCSLCGGLTERTENPCKLCSDPLRDVRLLCVVESPGDIRAIERSGAFRGRYHCLMGRISPARRSGPADVRLRELVERVDREEISEAILALSTDMEGDASAAMIAEMLRDRGVRVTRLAHGLPADSGVGYSDPVTLRRALSGRQSA